MKQLTMALAALMLLAAFPSCNEEKERAVCSRTIKDADGSEIVEQYYCDNPNSVISTCNSCGNGGNGGGTGVVVFDPTKPNAYTQTYTEIEFAGVVANNPYENLNMLPAGALSDFGRRKQYKESYQVTPDMDRSMMVDPEIGASWGVDKNKMTIWTYSTTFGYSESVIDMNLVNALYVGAPIKITYSLLSNLPYAVNTKPSSNYQGYPMSAPVFANATAYYSKAQ